ncbi:MAG: autotransporter-associated beta strand repeat-containing protein [Negativicutes bacterium]|nr:autotransporter-associated beta strand repeat-containing protein [Negativicutes bacterium]
MRGSLKAHCRSPSRRLNLGDIRWLTICALFASSAQAFGASNIESGSTYQASNLGGSVNPDFKGGTLKLDTATTISNDFTFEDYSGNTIDENGHAVTFSGAMTGAGGMVFSDTVGGGSATLTSSGNTYSGATTINSSATLLLNGAGTIASSSSLTNYGTFDISQTTSGATIVSLAGAGSVILGSQSLTITSGAGTFSGAISGSGGLTLTGGSQYLTGDNSYTGGTTIKGGTLIVGDGAANGWIIGNVAGSGSGTLSFNRSDNVTFSGTVSGAVGLTQAGSGILTLTGANNYTGVTTVSAGTLVLGPNTSIASSSLASVSGILDVSAASSNPSVGSLSGAGTVQLGSHTLILTAANDTFTGVITGGGGLTLNGGKEILTGANTYTGATIVNGGTLEVGSAAVGYNVTVNGGVFGFYSSSAVAMSGVVSGAGGLSQLGTGLTTISSAQSYTGITTISFGTLALTGAGSIASSSSVQADGIFDISSETGGTSIASLTGGGAVHLGVANLTIANASGQFAGTISGSGGLILAGGKETLAGANVYTGVTTISSGTLYLGASNSISYSANVADNGVLDISGVVATGSATNTSITSISGAGGVVLGSQTLVLSGAAGTFAGVISGTGGLTLTGGTETLEGNNTYTGLTVISSGQISIAGSGTLAGSSTILDNGVLDISDSTNGVIAIHSLSGGGVVKLGANTLSVTGASADFSGVISGSGSLVIDGGSQTLSGINTYVGGTTINAGTLTVGDGGTSGSIAGNITTQGTLAFNRSDTLSISSTISGTGAVAQVGLGTTILAAANSYTGGTSITAGTLQIGDGGTTGSIIGGVSDAGTLAFDHSDPVTFSGQVSGPGGLTQIGAGELTLTGVSSYTGITNIHVGSVIALISNGSIAGSQVNSDGKFDVSAATISPQIASLSGAGSVAIGSQILTLTAAAGNFSGTISGTGELVLNGGTEILSGTNSYSGLTVVNGGTLAVNGSIAASSAAVVNSGGTISGTGTIPTATINAGGVLAPGAGGAGTLNVNGPVTFSTKSNFAITVSSTGAPKLAIQGNETLSGSLSVVSADGTYLLGQKVAVLTATGGISGTFAVAPIASTGAQFTPKISYDADDVFLEIDLAKLYPLLPSGSSINQANAVRGIDAAIAAGNAVPVRIQNLGNVSPATLAQDASQLSGELGASLAQIDAQQFQPLLNAISDHILDTDQYRQRTKRQKAGGRVRFWGAALTSVSMVNGDPDNEGTHRLKSTLAGLVGGADLDVSPRLLIGAALSLGTSDFRLASGFGKGSTKGVQAALYGSYNFNSVLYNSYTAAVGFDNFSTQRSLTIEGTDLLIGKVTSEALSGRYELGAHFDNFSPYLAFQGQLYRLPDYHESAASGSDAFALDYASKIALASTFEMGFRHDVDLRSGSWTFVLTDRLAWSHSLNGIYSVKAAYYSLPNSEFSTLGASPDRDAALLSLGVAANSDSGLSLNVHLNSATTGRSQTFTEMGGVSVRW